MIDELESKELDRIFDEHWVLVGVADRIRKRRRLLGKSRAGANAAMMLNGDWYSEIEHVDFQLSWNITLSELLRLLKFLECDSVAELLLGNVADDNIPRHGRIIRLSQLPQEIEQFCKARNLNDKEISELIGFEITIPLKFDIVERWTVYFLARTSHLLNLSWPDILQAELSRFTRKA